MDQGGWALFSLVPFDSVSRKIVAQNWHIGIKSLPGVEFLTLRTNFVSQSRDHFLTIDRTPEHSDILLPIDDAKFSRFVICQCPQSALLHIEIASDL
jgi:hypothetical protein